MKISNYPPVLNVQFVFLISLFIGINLLIPLQVSAQKPILALPFGHTDFVTSLSFSADGKTLLSTSEDGTLRLWNIPKAKLIQTSQSLELPILEGAVLSPDAKFASYARTKWYRKPGVWDIEKNTVREYNQKQKISGFVRDKPIGIDRNGKFIPLEDEFQALPEFDFKADGLTPDGTKMYQFENGSVKYWSYPSGKALKTITLEGSPKNLFFSIHSKVIYEVTVSNQVIQIEFWDSETGEKLNTFSVPEGTNYQDVSPDGSKVLLYSASRSVQLIDAKSANVLWDYSPKIRFQKEADFKWQDATNLVFSPDGKLVAQGNDDGSIHILNAQNGALMAILQGHVSTLKNIRFSGPDHTQIQAGAKDGILRTWDIQNGKIVSSVGSFLSDAVSGNYFIPKSETEYYHYVFGKRLEVFNLRDRSVNKIMDLQPLKSTEMMGGYSESLNQIFTIKKPKDNRIVRELQRLDLATLSSKMAPGKNAILSGISADGKTGVAWERSSPVLKNLSDLSDQKTLQKTQIYHDGMSEAIFSPLGKYLVLLENYQEGTQTKTQCWDIESGALYHIFSEGGSSTCGAFSNDESVLALGNWYKEIQIFDMPTKELKFKLKGHEAKVISLSFSKNNKWLLSASDDGMMKIWDLKTGKELVSLISIDKKEWVVLGPGGLFDASQNAMQLLYYLVDYGDEKVIIELQQLKDRYYVPGLLQNLLGFANEYVPTVDKLGGAALFPEVNASIKNDQLNIELKPRNGGIGKVQLFMNGKEIKEDANPEKKENIKINLRNYQRFCARDPNFQNYVNLKVYNADNYINSGIISIDYNITAWAKGNTTETENEEETTTTDVEAPETNSMPRFFEDRSDQLRKDTRAKMFAICIGTSDYTGTQLDLNFADQDAITMAKALEAVGDALFTKDSLEVYCLSTTKSDTSFAGTKIKSGFASKENIEKTFKTLKSKAKPEDIILVYLSGHGIAYGAADKAQFYYLTHAIKNSNLSDKTIRDNYTISSNDLTKWINDIPALKQVLIVDACNSGALIENLSSKNLTSAQIKALDKMQDRTGMFMISGSSANQLSFEASEYGQGLLTYSILQGMIGRANVVNEDTEKFINVRYLFDHAFEEVPHLAAGIAGTQEPMMRVPPSGKSFDIGIFNEQILQAVGKKKPVFFRSNFLNKETFIDDLDLVKALEIEMRYETAKGKEADLIYVDVNNYPNGYSLGGLYTEKEDKIEIDIKLFKDKQFVQNIKVRDTKNPTKLAQHILVDVQKIIDKLESE